MLNIIWLFARYGLYMCIAISCISNIIISISYIKKDRIENEVGTNIAYSALFLFSASILAIAFAVATK
jgi:hypothetical protein